MCQTDGQNAAVNPPKTERFEKEREEAIYINQKSSSHQHAKHKLNEKYFKKNENKYQTSVVSSHGKTRNEAFRSLRNSSFLSETEEILAFVFCSNTDFTGQGKNV